MKIEVYAKPEWLLHLNKEQLETLIWLSENHYDAVCRNASQPSSGGFIRGWHNWASCCEEPVIPASANFRQIDICLKILEGLLQLPTEQERSTAMNLNGDLRRALSAKLPFSTDAFEVK